MRELLAKFEGSEKQRIRDCYPSTGFLGVDCNVCDLTCNGHWKSSARWNGQTTTSPSITVLTFAKSTEKQGERRHQTPRRKVPGDLETYIRLCEAGKLYEALSIPGDARDKIKKSVFVNFYGWQPICKRFAERFRSVAKVISELKARNYRRVAWTMQFAESSVFIGSICGRIMREKPHTPILTIHDSILTTPPHVAYVECVILDEFESLDVRPTLHSETYCPSDGETMAVARPDEC